MNEGIQRKYKVARVALLANLTVHSAPDVHAFPRIDFIRDQRTDWTKRIKAFGTRPLTVFFLKIAGAHIVHRGVTKNVGMHIFIGWQFVTALGDHHAELAFVIDTLGNGWTTNVELGLQQGRGRFKKK